MKFKKNTADHVILLILMILVLLPLAAVLFQIVCPGLQAKKFNLKNMLLLGDVFVRPLWKRAFLDSLFLSVGTTVLGLILAAFLAHIRVSYDFAGAKLLDIASWILMIVPSFILAQGWVYFSSGNGIASSWLGMKGISSFVFSYWGLVTVMVLCKYPMAYVAIKAAMEWYPARLISAARMNGASSFQAWKSVQLPLCIPAYCSAAMLIFMDTVGDYGMSSTITAVYSFPTLPYTIYSAICSSPARFDMAGVLSVYLMIMIVLAMFIQFKAMGKGRYDFLDNGTEKVMQKKVKPVQAAFLSIVAGAFMVLSLGIPIGSNLIMSFSDSISIRRFQFTFENYKSVFAAGSSLKSGILHSLSLALISAFFGIIVGFCVAYVLTYSKTRLKKAIDMTTLIAMAVPGVVLGIGYIFVWNQKWLGYVGLHLYGKPAILVLASVASAIPLINRVLVGGMAKVPESLLIAAEIQGAGFWERIRTVLLPLLHNSTVSATLAAFGGSVFNLAITTILYPPNYSTLPVFISDSYNDLKFGIAAAATIVGAVFIIGIMLLLELLLNIKVIREKAEKSGKAVKQGLRTSHPAENI
ncbi:MAG: iron ABC transporter permease [Lachnospiraceae bacterium]|nr:iron ABC transporter permease [Lachnospiraceae bacterium]